MASDAHAEGQVTWKKLYTKHGVTISVGERNSFKLPILKGTGVLNVNLYHLLGIVEDVSRHNEWVDRVVQSELIRRKDAFNATAYMRFDFPWPASDRDGILRVRVDRKWSPHHEVWIHFTRAKDAKKPPQKDAIRVPRSKGFIRLRWINPQQTHVVYQIDTDPGGLLPKWLVRWIATDLPAKIIKGLQRQVKRTKGTYTDFIKRWDPRSSSQKDSPPVYSLVGVPNHLLKYPKTSLVPN